MRHEIKAADVEAPARRLRVKGGVHLSGVVELSAAKNSMLRQLVATILTNEQCVLHPFPAKMLDASILWKMLKQLGKQISFVGSSIVLNEPSALGHELRWSDRSIRSTILMAAALLTRFGKACVPNPGGCAIGEGGDGERKIDLHLMIFERMGAQYWTEGDYLWLEAAEALLVRTSICPYDRLALRRVAFSQAASHEVLQPYGGRTSGLKSSI